MTESQLIVDGARGWQRGRIAMGQTVSNVEATSYIMRVPKGREVINKVLNTYDTGNTLMHINERLASLPLEDHREFAAGLSSVFMGLAGAHLRTRASMPGMDISSYPDQLGNSFTGTAMPSIDLSGYMQKAKDDEILSFQFRETQAKALKELLEKDGNLNGLYTQPSRFHKLDVSHFIKYYLGVDTFHTLSGLLIEKGKLFEECVGIMEGKLQTPTEDQMKAKWEGLRKKFENSALDRPDTSTH